MQAIENHLLGHSTQALLAVWEALKRTRISDLISKAASRKADSLKLDVLPENIIRKKLIEDYDRHLVLVTEESGEFNFSEITSAEIVAFSDPTDRSKQFSLFLDRVAPRNQKDLSYTLSQLAQQHDLVAEWEEMFKVPARLSGSCCSITMVKRGEILFSIMLNYITQEIIIACDQFVGYKATKDITPHNGQYDYSSFTPIKFNYGGNTETYVTYLGKEIYKKCLTRTGLIPENYSVPEIEPGGPLRILYLSDICNKPVEFVLANGEKIGEWLGWLAFCKFSQDLVVLSLYPESDFSQKDDILMYPSPPYSILENKNGKLILNYSKLMHFKNPSRYRELVMVTHKDNDYLRGIIESDKARTLVPSKTGASYR